MEMKNLGKIYTKQQERRDYKKYCETELFLTPDEVEKELKEEYGELPNDFADIFIIASMLENFEVVETPNIFNETFLTIEPPKSPRLVRVNTESIIFDELVEDVVVTIEDEDKNFYYKTLASNVAGALGIYKDFRGLNEEGFFAELERGKKYSIGLDFGISSVWT